MKIIVQNFIKGILTIVPIILVVYVVFKTFIFLDSILGNVLKPYLNVIDEIIEEGMEENIFRKNLNLPLVRQMIFGTLDETVTTWVMKDHRYGLVEQAKDVHQLIIHGISSNESF